MYVASWYAYSYRLLFPVFDRPCSYSYMAVLVFTHDIFSASDASLRVHSHCCDFATNSFGTGNAVSDYDPVSG